MTDIFKRIYRNNRGKVLLLSIMTVITSILGIGLPYLNGKFIDGLINLKEVNQIIKLISLIIILGVVLCQDLVQIKMRGSTG